MRKIYKAPPPKFKKGERVRSLEDGQTYRVIISTHAHSQLEGVHFAIANWKLSRVKKPKA